MRLKKKITREKVLKRLFFCCCLEWILEEQRELWEKNGLPLRKRWLSVFLSYLDIISAKFVQQIICFLTTKSKRRIFSRCAKNGDNRLNGMELPIRPRDHSHGSEIHSVHHLGKGFGVVEARMKHSFCDKRIHY